MKENCRDCEKSTGNKCDFHLQKEWIFQTGGANNLVPETEKEMEEKFYKKVMKTKLI